MELLAGVHRLRLASKPLMSHIDRIQLVPVTAAHEALAKLEKERAKFAARVPKPIKVMAVNEGKVADSRINKRGNPHDLGVSVARGFLESIGPKSEKLPAKNSGRLEWTQWRRGRGGTGTEGNVVCVGTVCELVW